MIYKPMQKVIWYQQRGFDKPELVVGWVSKPKYYPCMSSCDGKWCVLVTVFEDEAGSGKGTYERVEKVQPYSDDIWQAVELLNKREGEIWKQRYELSKGKVPEGLLQLNLL